MSLLLDINYMGHNATIFVRYASQAAAHTIWRERNRRRHGEKKLPYTLLIKVIDKTIRNRLSTIKKQGDRE